MTLQIHGQVVPSGHSQMNKTPEDWRPWRVPLGANSAWESAVTIEDCNAEFLDADDDANSVDLVIGDLR